MTACQSYADLKPIHQADAEQCGQPSIGMVLAGCVHEHLARYETCSGCAADLQFYAQMTTLVCPDCYRADGHLCRLGARIEWADGTATVLQEVAS